MKKREIKLESSFSKKDKAAYKSKAYVSPGTSFKRRKEGGFDEREKSPGPSAEVRKGTSVPHMENTEVSLRFAPSGEGKRDVFTGQIMPDGDDKTSTTYQRYRRGRDFGERVRLGVC